MTPPAELRPVEILLVEDNPGDARLTREALRDAKLWHRLRVVTDGVEALAYLRREGGYAGEPRPDFVLLDLHLPRKDGWQVVAEMGRDERLRDIPVGILAGVPEGWESSRGEASPVACVLTKPFDFRQFLTLVRAVGRFKLMVVALTSDGGASS